jgi:hypothetical protein
MFESSSSVVTKQTNGASSTAIVADFSALNVDSIDGVQIKRLPAGESLGAHDLERWSNRRSVGLSKSYSTKDERKRLKHWTQPTTTQQTLTREDAAKVGILIERTERGWMASMPDGSNAGPFQTEATAWSWVDRQPARRYRAEFARCGLTQRTQNIFQNESRRPLGIGHRL